MSVGYLNLGLGLYYKNKLLTLAKHYMQVKTKELQWNLQYCLIHLRGFCETYSQCCGAGAGVGAARSRRFLLEPEPEKNYVFGSGSGNNPIETLS